MLLLEQDAKELLAIQGVPVPGAIRLAHIPEIAEGEDAGRSGPWLVKPQVLAAPSECGAQALPASGNAEVAAAAAALLNRTIAGQTVQSVLVERQMAVRGSACLRFRCDPATAGIRIEAGAGGAGGADIAAPDPGAVIDCVARLAAALDGEAQACVAEAGRLLAPLYFGYEAALLEVDPLTILADGSWAVGNVQLVLDENALFRHPELVSLVERRPNIYADVQRIRACGVDHRILDPDGTVGLVSIGSGLAALLADEISGRGLTLYNVMDAGAAALNGAPERMAAALDLLSAEDGPACILLAAGDGIVDVPAFAAQVGAALAALPSFAKPVIAHFAGTGAGAAGAILQQAYAAAQVEPDLDAALDAVARSGAAPA